MSDYTAGSDLTKWYVSKHASDWRIWPPTRYKNGAPARGSCASIAFTTGAQALDAFNKGHK